jgi:DNA-binding CsgD family transcriptional regulator
LVEIVEACYNVDGDHDAWATSVGELVEQHLGYGLGAIAIRYRLDDQLRFQPLAMSAVNLSDDAVGIVQRATVNLPPSYVQQTFAAQPADMALSTGPEEVHTLTVQIFGEHFVPQGWHDILCVNGLDPTHHGFYLGAFMPRRGKMTAALRTRWSRIAAHMAAAHRLRNRLSASELKRPDGADAVLTANGRVEHANDNAKHELARAKLVEGVRVLERARGKMRRTDPDLALSEWRALFAARWSLVDHFESDGKRYVLARRNAPLPRGLDALTSRERQALGFARLGHSNKLIAYEMGIAASTVAVLLSRAAHKLGCERDELVATYTRMLQDE